MEELRSTETVEKIQKFVKLAGITDNCLSSPSPVFSNNIFEVPMMVVQPHS